MEKEIISSLANKIVDKFKAKSIYVEKYMADFLEVGIGEKNLEDTLEQLYLFQLYCDAYMPDPRIKAKMVSDYVISTLSVKTDGELMSKIGELRKAVEILKNIETQPLLTIKKELEDREKNKGSFF